MIAKISMGRSFRGTHLYFMHDRGASTRHRIAWTHTENMLADAENAWKEMSYTALSQSRLKEASGQKPTGRRLEKPVFTYALAWPCDEKPTREHMQQTALESIRALGLEEHEILIVAHRDTKSRHCHVIINRVHPLTGLAGDVRFSKRKLSDFCREYERTQGRVVCPQREINFQKRQQKEHVVYRDPVITAAWSGADCGQSFQAALAEKGYVLAEGRKRRVVVDPYGKSINPLQHLESVRAREFQDRIKDLKELPNADEISREIQARNQGRYEESLRHDEWAAEEQNRMQDRHLEQRRSLSDSWAVRLDREQAALETQYRFTEQQRRIEALRAQARRRTWWKTLLGISRRQQRRLSELERTCENARWRARERLDALHRAREGALTRLAAEQSLEQRRTRERIRSQQPRDYANENERARIQQHARAGPSLG